MAQIINLEQYKKSHPVNVNETISHLKDTIQTKLILLDPLCEYFDASVRKLADDYIIEFCPIPGHETIEYYNSQFLLVGASIHVHHEVEQCIHNIDSGLQNITANDVQNIQLKLIEDLDRNSLIKIFETTDWYNPLDYFALIHLIPFFENLDRIIVRQSI